MNHRKSYVLAWIALFGSHYWDKRASPLSRMTFKYSLELLRDSVCGCLTQPMIHGDCWQKGEVWLHHGPGEVLGWNPAGEGGT